MSGECFNDDTNAKLIGRGSGPFTTGNTEHDWDLEKLRSAHKVLVDYRYEKRPVEKGYAGRILYVNLSTGEIREIPVTEEMKKKFTGGKGFGLKMTWDLAGPDTKWNDPENVLCLNSAPMNGMTQYSGTGKCLSTTISPSTDIICDSNAGGYFAPYLKFSGFDALAIQGKSKEDILLFIDGEEGRITIETAPLEEENAHLLTEQLTYMYAREDTGPSRQKVSVVTAGKAADKSYWGVLNISFYDPRRKVGRMKQHGRGGLGTVFRDKGLKALVARVPRFTGTEINPVDIDTIADTGIKHHTQIRDLDRVQCNMRTVGTGNLVEIMDAYDLLPTENYRFGSHPKASNIYSSVFYRYFTQGIPDGCWYGCNLACAKSIDGFKLRTGPFKGQKVSVDGPEYETIGGSSNMSIWDAEWIIEFNFYCDTYGLDTISAATATAFYMEMYEYHILNKDRCGGLELCFGNAEAVLEFLHRIASGDQNEFIQVASKGIRRVKDWIIKNGWGDPQLVEDCGMEVKGLEYSEYVTKESLAQQGGYAMASKGPQHDEAWLIFMDMVNNQIPTFKDKAEALHYFPIWRTWFGIAGLCKLPWNDITPANNSETDEPAKVPEHVENYAKIMSSVTGLDIKGKDLIDQSERVYNWQRAMNVWLGKGRRKSDIPPYRSMGPVTNLEYISRQERYDRQLMKLVGISEEELEKMSVKDKMKTLYDHRMEQYQKLMDAVYLRRGWTPNGVPAPQKMEQLGFGDETEMLEMLQKAIDDDDMKELNVWGANYAEDEDAPADTPRYWEKW
ncbi:MAG: aldehyde ferredoxin oxidoreductase C-terminal domain-containing protein [Candidatus Thermoplasmatota archaeon]|nr:aldehyde ferredoxin oxidoreductase C-terminal domain-containing protein [Candidatus Thermoplasmatota archaeon]